MSKTLILVIEDEEDILALIHYNLVKNGFRVECATSGEEGYKKARALRPDLVLLDLMLPGMDGTDVCRLLRQAPDTKDCPIIMLTAKTEEHDIVRGLDLGADDYIPKPFSPQILLSRVRAVLRRSGKPDAGANHAEPVIIRDLYIHPGRNQVLANDEAVELTYTEFKVLMLLASRPGWVFSRTQIVDAIHGEDYAVTERAVDVQIVGLRKKLGSCGDYIETVRGVGYRLKE